MRRVEATGQPPVWLPYHGRAACEGRPRKCERDRAILIGDRTRHRLLDVGASPAVPHGPNAADAERLRGRSERQLGRSELSHPVLALANRCKGIRAYGLSTGLPNAAVPSPVRLVTNAWWRQSANSVGRSGLSMGSALVRLKRPGLVETLVCPGFRGAGEHHETRGASEAMGGRGASRRVLEEYGRSVTSMSMAVTSGHLHRGPSFGTEPERHCHQGRA